MNIALIGYGKMGKAIEAIAIERGHIVLHKFSRKNQDDLTIHNLQQADVAIEFTNPEGAFENIKLCLAAGVPVVSGSTGWTNSLSVLQQETIDSNGAFIYASNFSVGVNIFFEVNKRLAALMANRPEYEIKLHEIHHTQKKDAPSGTALTLAEQILSVIPEKKLPITHERIDPAAGIHSISYESPIDTIEIKHTAHNRTGFATGAVFAAEFLVNKKGFFTMKDVLGL